MPDTPFDDRAAQRVAAHPQDDHPETISRNARVGLWLFGVYLLLYGGFMALNAFFPQRMAAAPFGGVNLAVLYGFLLIVAAFALALLYMFLVRRAAGGNVAGDGTSSGSGGR